MSHRHAICLVVDGLRASGLGAYGNTSFPTPQLDALASRSLVADWMWADSPHLPGFYRSAWQGVHALRAAGQYESVLEHLQNVGVRQWLVSDEPWLTGEAGHLPFDDALLFENEAERAAERNEETTFGRYFSEVVERLHQWREDAGDASSMAWLHSRGMYGPWDAPLHLREDLLDDEDPAAEDFIHPPTALREIDDPDVLLKFRAAYGAQVALLDACVGAFVPAVEEVFAGSETLLMLLGSRGFALGEHGSIGTECAELHGERLHLPWLIYPCGNTTPLPRLFSLSQPADIGQTLLDWLRVEKTAQLDDGISCLPLLASETCKQRQLAVSTSDASERVVRTPAWMLRRCNSGDMGESSVELFTKPDDRWESNNVAGLCPEVIEQLSKELVIYEQCCLHGKSLPIVPGDEELIKPTR